MKDERSCDIAVWLDKIFLAIECMNEMHTKRVFYYILDNYPTSVRWKSDVWYQRITADLAIIMPYLTNPSEIIKIY